MSNTAIAPLAQPPAVPDALKPHRQFVLWRLIGGNGKPRKVPFDAKTGTTARVDDQATWCDYSTAIAAYQRGGFDGLGFVLTPSDPFVFVDLDDCRDPATGAYTEHATEIVKALPGAWEVSQSGKGLHGIGLLSDPGQLADRRRKWTDAAGNRHECYPHHRFMAIGGSGWTGEPVADWTGALAGWIPRAEQEADFPAVQWIDQPRAGYDGPTHDDDLIARALASRGGALAIFGNSATFAELWAADPGLGRLWPDDARAFDHSSADLALCNALAWWTGCNPVRMLRLFKRSALWRDDERKARLAIVKAVADPGRAFFSRAQRLRDDERIGDDLAADAFPEVLTIEQAIADLVHVGHGSLVVSRRTKRVRTHADAVNEWAASKFAVETGRYDRDGRPITKDVPVIKIWLESRDRRTADVLTWAPGEAEFCASPERQQAGDRAFNLWTPPALIDPPADWLDRVQPFLQHVEYLVPIASERARFIGWLAHIFQRPGELPHTAYLMTTETTGTGRGTLASILTRALRGYVAANVTPDTLFGTFNGRLSQKLLATVDEIREGNSRDRYAKAESLKSKITEEYRSINPKYGAQSVERNCCRWLMFSNHRDALPFDNSDRRIIVIENPAARAQPEWYAYLHDQMADPAFIASVQHYLSTLPLAGFDPHEPAPLNDAKRRALDALTSDVERAFAQFQREWPGDFATVSDLMNFVGAGPMTTSALSHEVRRAGMQTAKRVMINGTKETVLIVRGDTTRADLEPTICNARLVEAITGARAAARLSA